MSSPTPLDGLRGVMKPAVEALRKFDGLVRVVSHYDADGISSAGIISKALMHEGKRFRLSFVKGINAKVFEALEHEGFVIILDMGSGQLETIRELSAMVVICDHHSTPKASPVEESGSDNDGLGEEEAENKEDHEGQSLSQDQDRFASFSPMETDKGVIYEFNSHRFGIDGSYAACGASVSYAFATAMSRMNSSLSSIALAGIIGDKQENPLQGINKNIIDEGIHQGYIQEKKASLFLDGDTIRSALIYAVDPYFPSLTGREAKVEAFLKECGMSGSLSPDGLNLDQKRYLADRLMLLLLANNSPPEAIEKIVRTRYFLSEFELYADTLSNQLNACGRKDWMTTGVAACLGERTAISKSVKLREKYRSTIRNGLLYLESRGIKRMNHIQYFSNNDPSSSGAFAGLGIQYLFDRSMPIVALSKKGGKIHVSSRGTRELVDSGLDLATAMRDAGSMAGGYGGGHPIAAGATLPEGKENEFLSAVDGIVGEQFVLHLNGSGASEDQ